MDDFFPGEEDEELEPTTSNLGTLKASTSALPVPSIVINSTTFKLIGKIERHETLPFTIAYKQYVAIIGCSDLSETEGVPTYSIFWVYQSTSELGIWRLAGTYIGNNGQMNKLSEDRVYSTRHHSYFVGDYVQSTLIHLDLQHFLNDTIKNSDFPILTLLDATNIIPYIQENVSMETLPPLTDANYISPYTVDPSNPGPTDPSLILVSNGAKPTYGVKAFKESLPQLSPEVRAIHNRTVNYPYPFIYMSVNHVSKSSTAEPRPSPEPFFQCGLKGDVEVLNKFSEMFNEIYEVESVEKIADHTNKFENLIDVSGEIFKMELKRKEDINPEFLSYSLEYLKTKEEKTKIKEKNITINSETDILPNVTLYYLKTLLICGVDTTKMSRVDIARSGPYIRNVQKVCSPGIHFMPICLTVPNVRANTFGLYSEYINAGSYICKMFDYHYQCFPHENAETRCTATYTYIGNRYNKMFPFNTMLETSTAGGKRKNRKTKRRRCRPSKRRTHRLRRNRHRQTKRR